LACAKIANWPAKSLCGVGKVKYGSHKKTTAHPPLSNDDHVCACNNNNIILYSYTNYGGKVGVVEVGGVVGDGEKTLSSWTEVVVVVLVLVEEEE